MRNLQIDSLEPKSKKWHDKDEVMLHACFQLLKDFVEKEGGDKHANYETHKDFIDELNFLYNWWKDRVKIPLTYEQTDIDDVMLLRLMKIRSFMWT